jgi:hypothetical protein
LKKKNAALNVETRTEGSQTSFPVAIESGKVYRQHCDAYRLFEEIVIYNLGDKSWLLI